MLDGNKDLSQYPIGQIEYPILHVLIALILTAKTYIKMTHVLKGVLKIQILQFVLFFINIV
jgi:hypothetical protein